MTPRINRILPRAMETSACLGLAVALLAIFAWPGSSLIIGGQAGGEDCPTDRQVEIHCGDEWLT